MSFHHLLASGLYSGYSPKAPGTVGSLVCLTVWYLASSSSQRLQEVEFQILTALIVGIVGLWATRCTLNERRSEHAPSERGKVDPQFIVIDEWAGLLVALIGISPDRPLSALASFALFRLFDIMKPGPVRKAELLPGEWGIMVDDMVAGGLALVTFQLVLIGIELL